MLIIVSKHAFVWTGMPPVNKDVCLGQVLRHSIYEKSWLRCKIRFANVWYIGADVHALIIDYISVAFLRSVILR